MSVDQARRFRAEDSFRASVSRFRVIDDGGRSLDGAPLWVDSFRNMQAAVFAADELNAGRARVNPHGLIGCRVEYVR